MYEEGALALLALADLDVVAEHRVIASLEARDAGRFAFTVLEFGQDLIGIGFQAAQLVEFLMEPRAEEAAVRTV